MTDFKVDIEAFSLAISKYENEIENMKNIEKQLGKCLETLKNDGWNSNAGKTFMNKFDKSWCENVEKYIELINFLNERLKAASYIFEDLKNEADKLQYKD